VKAYKFNNAKCIACGTSLEDKTPPEPAGKGRCPECGVMNPVTQVEVPDAKPAPAIAKSKKE